MKQIFKLFIFIIGTCSLSSCAIHNGYMANSASLSQANFSYTKQSISGHASTTKVFGIGGLWKQTLVEEAKKEMLEETPLQDNQALANITVNWKRSCFFFIVNNKCTVTADIVEFK